jgi:hypothetical protein
VKGVVNWFKWLFDILLGHSIIPDIVHGAIDWFNRPVEAARRGIVPASRTGRHPAFRALKDSATKTLVLLLGPVTSTASDTWRTVRKGWDTFATA